MFFVKLNINKRRGESTVYYFIFWTFKIPPPPSPLLFDCFVGFVVIVVLFVVFYFEGLGFLRFGFLFHLLYESVFFK